MNKNRIRCGFIAIFFAICTNAVLLAAMYIFYYGPRTLEQKRSQEGPPSILVYSPHDGETISAGSLFPASATAAGANPLSRVELWLDGEIFGTQTKDNTQLDGISTIHALFDMQITAGPHMLSWRAVDNTGLVGQTIPISIFGSPALDDPGVTIASAEEGQTLVDIAADHNVDPNLVRDINPGIGEEKIPAGTEVMVPKPGDAPADQPPPTNPPPAPLPAIPPGTSMLQPVSIDFDISQFIPIILKNFPKVPSELEVGVEDCTVRLKWTDNAENETNFKVWMQALGGPPRVIATLKGSPATGPAWYEFKSPSFGIYSIWIEAVNAFGGQASVIKWFVVTNAECRPAIASHLEIEATAMEIFTGNWDKVYCYVSLEGASEQRIPHDDSEFLEYNGGGSWNISKWAGGKNRLLLPIPMDEEVSLQGKCMGWHGNDGPHLLGTFQESVSKEGWDGKDRQILSTQYVIIYRIRPFGPTQAQGTYTYLDYSLKRPYNLSITRERATDPIEDAKLSRYPTLSWDWDGNPDEVTNFTILANDEFFRSAHPVLRELTFRMPSTCGGTYSFQVAANSNEARSIYSDPVLYTQPPCPVMAEVHFMTVISGVTDDTSCKFPDMSSCFRYDAHACDQMGVYYMIWASGAEYVEERYGSEQMSFHYTCGIEFQFSNQLGATRDTFVVPIDPSDPELRFGTRFWESDLHNDDGFGLTGESLKFNYDEWPGYDKVHTLVAPFANSTADAIVKVHVRAYHYPGP